MTGVFDAVLNHARSRAAARPRLGIRLRSVPRRSAVRVPADRVVQEVDRSVGVQDRLEVRGQAAGVRQAEVRDVDPFHCEPLCIGERVDRAAHRRVEVRPVTATTEHASVQMRCLVGGGQG